MLASAALVLWAGRDTVFRADDWDLLLYRQGFNSDVLLHPHNEHLVALQILALKGIGALGGLHHYAYRFALLTVDLVVCGVFFLFARERVGALLAALTTLPLLFLGSAADSFLWSAMLGVMASLACGIGAIILLDRESLRARIGACLLLLAAIGFETNGLFFLLCTLLWLLLAKRWRDLWIPIVPAIAYYAWYTGHGTSQFTSGNLEHTPEFMAKLGFTGFSALSGVAFLFKHPHGLIRHAALVAAALIGVALAVAAIWLIWRQRPRIGPRTVAIASLPLAYWLLVSLGRAEGGDPYASRYIFASVLFILMLLLELARNMDLKPVLRGRVAVVLLVLLAGSVLANARVMERGGDEERNLSQHIRARTTAIEVSRRTIDQNIYLVPLQTVGNMRTGWYLNAEDNFGESPVAGTVLADLLRPARTEADQTLAEGDNAGLYPPLGASPTGPCGSAAPGGGTVLTLPRDGLLVLPAAGASATVTLRRFGPNFKHEPSFGTNRAALLKVSPDLRPRPWRVLVAATGPTRLCPTRISTRRLLGPPLPPTGYQHCEDFNTGTPECSFRRYFPRSRRETP